MCVGGEEGAGAGAGRRGRLESVQFFLYRPLGGVGLNGFEQLIDFQPAKSLPPPLPTPWRLSILNLTPSPIFKTFLRL